MVGTTVVCSVANWADLMAANVAGYWAVYPAVKMAQRMVDLSVVTAVAG